MDRANQRMNHLSGRNIKRLRLEKGLRNKDMVVRLQTKNVGMTAGTYGKTEMGLNNPSADLLVVLTDIFGCDFNTFFVSEKEDQE